MNEENIERIRRKKSEEQKKATESKKAQEQLRSTLRVVLEENAYDRIMNVSIANEQLFLTAAQNLLGVYQKVGRKIRDDEVLYILKMIKNQNEKKTSISFERK